MVGIYKITNLLNGKVYIGQSINIAQRWKDHRSRPFQKHKYDNSSLYRAIQKYGLDNFLFEVIEECSSEELNAKEQFWIKQYKSYLTDFGYNLTMGGDAGSKANCKLSVEQVKEIYDLLANTTQTQTSIAQQYGVKQNYISDLNQGIYQAQPGYTFPIRPLYFDQRVCQTKTQSLCPKCGKAKDKKAILCLECYQQQWYENKPTRDELKAMIRTQSFTQIGKTYKVTDNAIKKWCDKYNLPRKKKDINALSDEEWANI